MTDTELKELVAGLAIAHEKTKKDLDSLIEQNKTIQAENVASFKETKEFLKNLGINIGGIANSNGQSTEEYFYNSLADNCRLGNIEFDEISKNLRFKKGGLEDEFDITLFNGKSVGLIECKYNAKVEDVMKLINKKVGNFKKLWPHFANQIMYLGIASFSFDKRTEQYAKENGVAILRQKGDLVEIEADNLKAY